MSCLIDWRAGCDCSWHAPAGGTQSEGVTEPQDVCGEKLACDCHMHCCCTVSESDCSWHTPAGGTQLEGGTGVQDACGAELRRLGWLREARRCRTEAPVRPALGFITLSDVLVGPKALRSSLSFEAAALPLASAAATLACRASIDAKLGRGRLLRNDDSGPEFSSPVVASDFGATEFSESDPELEATWSRLSDISLLLNSPASVLLSFSELHREASLVDLKSFGFPVHFRLLQGELMALSRSKTRGNCIFE